MSELTNRIDFLLTKTHQRRVDIVKATGINESTIRNWIRGKMPSAENLYQVAQFFGVSVEWLLTGKGDEELNQEREKLRQYELEIVDGLNFQERKLIELFRQLDEQNRNAIMLMANSLIKCSH